MCVQLLVLLNLIIWLKNQQTCWEHMPHFKPQYVIGEHEQHLRSLTSPNLFANSTRVCLFLGKFTFLLYLSVIMVQTLNTF